MPPLRSTGPFPEAEHPEYAGQYRLEAVLGNGGMGVVHLATSASGLRLAVKVIHAEHALDPEFRARFRQEVAAARRVSGAFTAPVVDADPDAGRPWMATLFIEGPTLADRVKRNGPLNPAELVRAGAGLAEALRDIHRAGVVHRDLKPSNVLLAADGPKVIDFGISRPTDSDLRTETGKLIGTPPFMAPEQFQRPREVGPEADVFALGAVLVHAATGRGPFDSDSPYIVAYQVVHDEPDLTGVPDDLAPLVARCLAKDPDERPTPAEIMAALLPPSYEATAFIPAQRRSPEAPAAEAVRDGEAVRDTDTRALRVAPAAGRPASRRRRPRALTALVALAVLAAGGTLAVRWAQQPDALETSRRAAATGPLDSWRTRLLPGGDTAPACAAGPGGTLHCSARGIGAARIDPGTGKVLWSRPLPAEAVAQPPVPAGGRVGTLTGERYATFDAATGAPGWGVDLAGFTGDAAPAGDVLLLGSPSGAVTALDGATGARLWQRHLRGHTDPRPGPYDPATGLVHVHEQSADGTRTLLSAVRARTGEVVHRRTLDGLLLPVATGPAGAVILTAQRLDSQTEEVVRYDPASGAAHRVRLPFRMGEPRVAVRGSTVYLLERTGMLVAVDTAVPGGRELWQLSTAAGPVSAPVLGEGDRLYLSAADGRLLAVDTARGALAGQTEPRLRGGRLGHRAGVAPPVVLGGRVVATAPDGSVFAVDGAEPGRW